MSRTRIRLFVWAVCFACGLWHASAWGGLVVTNQLVEDTYIHNTDYATHASDGTVLAGTLSSQIARSLFRAFGPDVPDGHTLSNATLCLYQEWSSGYNKTLFLYRIVTAWKETEANWYSNSTATAWGSPGLLAGTDYQTSGKAVATTPAANGFTLFDVTSDCQAFIGGSAANRGWLVCQSNETSLCRFRTCNDTTLSIRPFIVYSFEPIAREGLIVTNWAQADTQLHALYPASTYGTDTAMHVGTLSGSTARSLVFATVTNVPPNAVIRSARLRCYQDDPYVPYVDDIVEACRVLKPWEERAVNWLSNTVSTAWSSPGMEAGIDFLATPTDSSYVSSTVAQYVEFDVTADVQAYVSGAAVNNGWLLRKQAEGVASVARFRTREYGVSAQHPALIIRYETRRGTAILVY